MSEDANKYLLLLEHSYSIEKGAQHSEEPDGRLEYLGNSIFDFTTYDGDMDAFFARKAIEVCQAINNKRTFDYIADPDRYQWYLIMCNMPFFVGRLEWGMSIRGAWWDSLNGVKFHSCGLWEGEKQLIDIDFTEEQWRAFIEALIVFAAPEMIPP